MGKEKDATDDRKDVESTAKKIPYPKSVFCILACEFCERFNYYGMRAVLTIYLKNVLKFTEDDATIIYHAFTMLAYFTPLLGAMIADSLLGKFRTIFYLSVVYTVGSVILSLASTPPLNLPAVPFSMLGLVLIAFGTGGIKPCVSSFGGDQFVVPQQAKQLAVFFSIFYFSINAGSLVSTLLTPVFRKDVTCFDQETCYTLAFSVPAALMIVSLVVFLIGRPFYRINNPEGNVFIAVTKTIFHALSRKRKSKEKKEHWLDYADDKYSKRNIGEIKILLRVLFLYIPLPFFWALFDQQGSRWTFQATRMDGDIGFFFIKPDQMQVVNPLLILLFIPLFERIIYPLLARCNLIKKPLQRLTTGGVFAGIAFVVSGLVELELKTTYPTELSAGQGHLHLINMAPFELTGVLNATESQPFTIAENSNFVYGILQEGIYTLNFDANGTQYSCAQPIQLWGEKASSVLLTLDGNNLVCVQPRGSNPDSTEEFHDKLEKEEEGNPFIKVIQYGLWEDPNPAGNFNNDTLNLNKWNKVKLEDVKKHDYSETFEYIADEEEYSDWRSSPTLAVEVHEYEISIGTPNVPNPATGDVSETIAPLPGTINAKLGGSYILSIVRDASADGGFRYQLNEFIAPNSMHMLWLLPQYIIMTAGEVMFSVTIMDFSYTQAPVSMKSVMQSAWLLTVAFGNLIDVIVAALKIFDEQWKEFFFFAGLMFGDMLIFSYMAWRYVPADPNLLLQDLEHDEGTDEKKKGLDNEGYSDEKDR